jgi:hypothetical protein
MRISNYYMALNMLNDLSWIIVSGQNEKVSTDALTAIEEVRKTLLNAIKGHVEPPLLDLLKDISVEGEPTGILEAPNATHKRRKEDE